MTVEPAARTVARSGRWSLAERSTDLREAERHGVDLLIAGGGITGVGVLRDAATRGLRALLVERDDFASGTSSRSSKLIHGGLRYIAEGQLAVMPADIPHSVTAVKRFKMLLTVVKRPKNIESM